MKRKLFSYSLEPYLRNSHANTSTVERLIDCF